MTAEGVVELNEEAAFRIINGDPIPGHRVHAVVSYYETDADKKLVYDAEGKPNIITVDSLIRYLKIEYEVPGDENEDA